MPDDSGDIFIKFRKHDGQHLEGESTTQVGDSLLFTGFQAGRMFEIDSFSFSVGLSEDNDQHKHDNAGGHGQPGNGGGNGGLAGGITRVANTAASIAGRHSGKPQAQQQGGYKAFRAGTLGGAKYPVSVQPINITRPIDKSSPVLMRYCIATESFDRVSVVKRKAAGSTNAGEPYLRLDFKGVLIRDVSWTNDEPVKEVTQLISRAITVRYRPQLLSGKLGAPVVGFWSMLSWEKECDLK